MKSSIRIILFLLFVFVGNIYAQNKDYDDNTRILMLALDMQRHNYTKKSLYSFEYLFEKDKKYLYFAYILKLNIRLKNFYYVIELCDKYRDIFQKNEETIFQFKMKALVNTGKLDRALDIQKYLVKHYRSQFNLFELSKVYYLLENYKQSQVFAKQSLQIKPNTKIAIFYTNMLFNKMAQKDQAIKYMNNYIKNNKPEMLLYLELVKLYIKTEDKQNIAKNLKKMYLSIKLNHNNNKMIDSFSIQLIKFLDKNQKVDLRHFFEINEIRGDMLLSLYYSEKDLIKASALTKELYEETKEIKYFAQNTMLQYEIAKDKSKVLDEVISEFNYIIKKNKNSSYLNFLGYILIDHNIDITRGTNLVSNALIKKPKNIAYLDSLAWGYYKQKQCDKAKQTMDKIYKLKKITDKTIIQHNDKIRRCK